MGIIAVPVFVYLEMYRRKDSEVKLDLRKHHKKQLGRFLRGNDQVMEDFAIKLSKNPDEARKHEQLVTELIDSQQKLGSADLSPDETICVICQINLDEKDCEMNLVIQLSCHQEHIFHQKCLRQWLMKS